MELSIIVPVYLTESTLDRCLESIVGQTFEDFELILVDDGSPDNCPQMCDQWAKKDARIKVIHKKNGGLSDARNAGIKVATGEFITFVDSDDYLDKETYEKVMSLAIDCDIIEFQVYRYYGSEKQVILSFNDDNYHNMEDYWLKAKAYNHTYAWNKIFKSSLFRDIKFPVGRVFEDVATLPKLLEQATSVKTCSQGMYYYCSNPNGITATASGEHYEMLLNSHLPIIDNWFDSRYYLHVLNIQLDVVKFTGKPPRLPFKYTNPFAPNLTRNQRIKSILLNIFRIKGLCRLAKITHKIRTK